MFNKMKTLTSIAVLIGSLSTGAAFAEPCNASKQHLKSHNNAIYSWYDMSEGVSYGPTKGEQSDNFGMAMKMRFPGWDVDYVASVGAGWTPESDGQAMLDSEYETRYKYVSKDYRAESAGAPKYSEDYVIVK